MNTQGSSSFLSRLSRATRGAVLAFASLSSMGCASRFSNEALHAIAPNAGIIDVCMHFPMANPDATVVAFDSKTRLAVSDANWEKFKVFAAKHADFIYRFDPTMPGETASMLPEPYDQLSCDTPHSSNAAPLPQGVQPIAITQVTRDALVAVLGDEKLRTTVDQGQESASIQGKRFLGQLTPAGFGPRTVYSKEAVDQVEQMLRDTVRNGAPHVQDDSGGEISILDTKAGQVVGGLAAGASIGTVPGGWLVVTALQANPNLPKPTREFSAGQSLGEMGSGALQMFIGGGGTIGGMGLTGTGGGAVIGIPTCLAGVALMANGATTFLHGATTLVVTICKWDDLPKAAAEAQPLAAVAPKDSTPSAPAPQSGGAPPSTTPQAPPPPVKPAPTPVQAAKPVPAKPVPVPVKPAAKPTDPTVVTIRVSGNKTVERPRLKDGEKPSDTTLTIRTDDAGKVQSMTVEVKAAELKPYNQGGGHHVPSKKAMEGAPNYDANKALAIPKAEMQRLGIDHIKKITPAQRQGYMEFAASGKKLTWEAVAKIETDALIKAEMNPTMAKATVDKAIQALKDSGVTGPVRIPWGN